VRGGAAPSTSPSANAPEEDEPWELLDIPLPAEARPAVEKGMAIAGKLLGHAAPKWDRVEAFFKEFLGTYGGADEGDEARILHWPLPSDDAFVERLEEFLEKDTAQWAFLDPVQQVFARRWMRRRPTLRGSTPS
jgi:hypothetical protein